MKMRLDWQPYVDDIAARMRLGHWDIRVLDEAPASEGSLATIQCWHGRYVAEVRFSDNFLAGRPAERRHGVVHELVHCYFAHADRLVEDDLSTDTGKAYRLATEYAVDAVAMTLAAFLPLPPGRDRRRTRIGPGHGATQERD